MADGIMDRIETINNIPLCDREARTLLEGKANVDHTHDNYATKTELNLKADVIHTHSDYVLKSDLTNILNRLTTLENKYTEILTRLNNIDTKLDELEGGIAHPSVMYPITYNLGTGIILNHQLSNVEQGASMEWTITCSSGYKLDSGACYITMGGVDVSSNAFHYDGNNNIISIGIGNVTGNINIKLASKSTTVPCTSISLFTNTITLYEINGIATNTASVLPANTTDTIRWESSNPAVATVKSDRGTITAVSEGKCVVTAYCGDQKASCNVTVEIEESYNIRYYLTGVTSSNNQQTINEKEAYYSVITLTDNKYSIASAKLTINGVAKNQYLTVTDRVIVDIPAGIINGDVVITVNTQEKTYPCTSLTCWTEVAMKAGSDTPLGVQIQPSNCTDELYWEISDPSALSVYKTTGATNDGRGNIYAHAVTPGSYIVTFHCGEKIAKTTVVISATTIKCTDIAFNVPSIRVNVNEGSWDCAQYLILTPSNTTDTVEWYTDTEDYFYVAQNGAISFNKVGTYKVQARCNNLSATLTVIIN